MSTSHIPAIRTKKEFYALSRRLQLGNCLQQWPFPQWQENLFSHGFIGIDKFSLRTAARASDRRAQRYRITANRMERLCRRLICEGYKPEDLLVDESAPDDTVLLQGEVLNTPEFVELFYVERSGIGMRQAFPLMKPVAGIRAVQILRHYLDADSCEDLFQILAEYHTSVVEFSVYPKRVGRLQRNTLIWEVRTGY